MGKLWHRVKIDRFDQLFLNIMFTEPFIKQQIDYSKVLNGKYSKNKDFSYVLGYDTSVEDSVLNWRKRRKARFSKKV